MINLILGIAVWMILVPFLTGTLIMKLFHGEEESPALNYIIGYLAMFAVCEVIVVPLILLRAPFHLFVWILMTVYALLSLGSVIMCGRKLVSKAAGCVRSAFRQPWTVYAAVAAVAFQASFYVRYMVTNLDDAYYVATSQTALQTDTMYRFSAYTGRTLYGFHLRYILSPYSMIQAFFSKLLGVSASTFAHTILPPFLLIVGYLVYYCLGRLLFSEKALRAEGNKKVTDRDSVKLSGLFVLIVSMVVVTSYYCVRTQGSVMLVRIWQGKATLASVLVPFLFYHCYRMYLEPERQGGPSILIIATTACCLVSSMGIALPPIMLGIFALLFGLLKKNIRYFLYMVLACIPPAVFGALYLILKALEQA